MAGRHSAAGRSETGRQGRRTLQDPLSGMSPPAGDERGVLRFQQQGLVDQERGRRADPQGREYSDLAYRDRSRAGGRHGGPNRRGARNLGIKSSRFAFALGELVEKTVNTIFDQRKPPASPAERKRIDGYMPNEMRGELAYKVRPLNGIWATPPYLHNGSVPTIDDLLGDPEKRPPTFYLGSREYDPVSSATSPTRSPTASNSTPRFAATQTGATNSGRTSARPRKSRA